MKCGYIMCFVLCMIFVVVAGQSILWDLFDVVFSNNVYYPKMVVICFFFCGNLYFSLFKFMLLVVERLQGNTVCEPIVALSVLPTFWDSPIVTFYLVLVVGGRFE